MNMNPLLVNIVVLEKELEIERQKHRSRRDNISSAESVLNPKRKKHKKIFGWIRRRQACEPS